MRQANRRGGRGILVLGALIIVLIGVVLAVTLGGGDEAAAQEMDGAVAFLRQLEAGDPDQVVQVIRQQQKARMDAEREQLRDKLLNGEIDVWGQFQEYVILGDSRASGFSYYSWLPSEYVLAEPGDTMWKIEDHLEEIKALNPARAYIAYGGNDLAYFSTTDEYVAEFARLIGEIQEADPGLEIYVNYILRAQDWVTSAGLPNAPENNTAIQAMCQQKGYTYVDCDNITAEHQDLYEGDGMHFKSAFYPYWASNLILATYYRGSEEDVPA